MVGIMKICSKCKQNKSLDDYYKNQMSWCKLCNNESSAKWRAANPDKKSKISRTYHIKSKYNLTDDKYSAMIINGCEVCGSFDKLCIDHDHLCCPGQKTCGKCIRGILCNDCNVAEGRLKSDKELVKALLRYLEKERND